MKNLSMAFFVSFAKRLIASALPAAGPVLQVPGWEPLPASAQALPVQLRAQAPVQGLSSSVQQGPAVRPHHPGWLLAAQVLGWEPRKVPVPVQAPEPEQMRQLSLPLLYGQLLLSLLSPCAL